MTRTAIGEALLRAGIKTTGSALYTAAINAVRMADRDEVRAARLLAWKIQKDEGLTREIAAVYLRSVVMPDMSGDELSGEGQSATANEGQIQGADARQQNGDAAGHRLIAQGGHPEPARPSSPDRDGAASTAMPKGRMALAAPVREPTESAKRAAAEVRQAAALTVMETMIVRGRGPWARIAVGSLHQIAVEGTRDAAIAKLLMREVPMGTPEAKSIRDVVSLKAFQRAVQKAAEVVDVEVGHAA